MSENTDGFNGQRSRPAVLPERGFHTPAPPWDICERKMPERPDLSEMLRDIPPERPVLIAGPTASGKSGLASRIVAEGGGVIVNGDALQVYDRWRVLTARPSIPEEDALPHRLYGHIGRDAPYSVGHWLREVEAVLAEGKRPVIVGGTGLYFTALTEGLAEIPPTPPDVRAQGDALLRADGLAEMVAALDDATAERIDLRNPARVQRAWEVLNAHRPGSCRLAGRHRRAAASAGPRDCDRAGPRS